MLKEERQQYIIEKLNKCGIIKVTDLTEELKATEMTIRRDLRFLEEKGTLIRIHGGARIKEYIKFEELSPNEKRNINTNHKIEVAKIAASLISDNDSIYIGPGTTTEYMYDYIEAQNVKIITNSLNIFEKFNENDKFEVILVGGRLTKKTGAFVGTFANETLGRIRVKMAFIGANGISENNIMTSNEEEGETQRIIMSNAMERYVMCDCNKIGKEDFYTLYKLEDITALVTNSCLDKELEEKYSIYCKIISKIREV